MMRPAGAEAFGMRSALVALKRDELREPAGLILLSIISNEGLHILCENFGGNFTGKTICFRPITSHNMALGVGI